MATEQEYSPFSIAGFVAYIMTDIRNNHVKSDNDFFGIVRDDTVIPHLVNEYGYFHMYPHESVIAELAALDPRITRHQGELFLDA